MREKGERAKKTTVNVVKEKTNLVRKTIINEKMKKLGRKVNQTVKERELKSNKTKNMINETNYI